MNRHRRPKLYPPKALLWQGPIPGPAFAGYPGPGHLPPPATTLSASELRRIVQEMLG